MSFNYGREEKKWRLWKEAEEKQLRGLGVDEDTIEKLHTYDWAVFNSDRRYYRRLKEAGTYLEEFAEDAAQPEVRTVEDFLNSIENQKLYQVLIKVDRLTLQIAVMKMQIQPVFKRLIAPCNLIATLHAFLDCLIKVVKIIPVKHYPYLIGH